MLVYWVNFTCGEIPYFKLPAKSSYDEVSYYNHSWVVREAGTGTFVRAIFVNDSSNVDFVMQFNSVSSHCPLFNNNDSMSFEHEIIE